MLDSQTPEMFEENYKEAIEKCKENDMIGKILKNLEVFKKRNNVIQCMKFTKLLPHVNVPHQILVII